MPESLKKITTQNDIYRIPDQNNTQGSLLIYPVPAKDIIQIKSDLPVQIREFAISDLSGRRVKYGKLKSNLINISDIQDGLYFLHLLTNNNDMFSNKILIK